MNPDLDFIFKRRSVRKFIDRDIPEQLLVELLEAAMAAPSAVARDPWHFLVIRDQDTLEKMADRLPNGQMLRQAGAAFLVCGDKTKAHDQQESYMLQDLSAATENILLSATALGLGSCWLGVHPRGDRIKDLSKLFNLPGNITPVSAIALGWPDIQPRKRTRYKEEKVHWDKW